MSIPAPDEISMEDPLCDSSLGSMVTLDYVTPLTSRAGGTTGTVEMAADAKSVAEIARARRVFQSVDVNACLWKIRVRSVRGLMLPRPL